MSLNPELPPLPQRVAVVRCPRSRIKATKTLLEAAGVSARRITKLDSDRIGGEEVHLLWTNVSVDESAATFERLGLGTVEEGGREGLEILDMAPCEDAGHGQSPHRGSSKSSHNPLETAASTFLKEHPCSTAATIELIPEAPRTYTAYPPLLLLPANAFTPLWQEYISQLADPIQEQLFKNLAESVGCTHLAINKPIPASDPVRKPLNLTPMYGSFGEGGIFSPTREDLEKAFWLTHRQNGIAQCWAPLYTMFSRGNVKEKARVLTLPDIPGSLVADFYAGIGYFTLSYLKAGARRVFCWEINPWSVEGLMRGARANGWKAVRVEEGEKVPLEGWDEDVRIVLFHEGNEEAEGRFRKMRELGLVRKGMAHVNLGLLPTSKGAWIPAAKAVRKRGGWIHVHENLGEEVVDSKGRDICEEIERESGRRCELRHIEKVKTFAPRVIHVVLDIWVGDHEEG